ncbi:COG2-domain-containing protein [Rhizopus microsporus var. microsporus]|uniref:Conserved oligomeric Golgi complex subunit 2 n=1 Tax=Rhizopus microsporus var. microsporus TaxID=86635 RepID=A0A1X0QVL8_RHIZD|nr:COG2-domain-containing protein [Rhizopus microsporus var. microsporus]
MSRHRKKQSIFSFSDDEDDNEQQQQQITIKPLPNHAVERSELVADDFDPDTFLSSKRHLGLERMKVELNAHLKQLKSELVELINRDYQDFINLSINLSGVDKDIEELAQPLNTIEHQVKEAQDHFQNVIESLQEQLQYRAQLRNKKATLKLLLNIHESISKVEYLLDINAEIAKDKYKLENQLAGDDSLGKQIERAAIEYNQMQHLVGRGKDLAFIKENSWRITRIKDTLEQKLSKALHTALLQVRAGELTRSTKQSLVQCLRTYALIDQTEVAEKIIKEQFVRWYLEKIIHSKILQNNKTSKEDPLTDMYKKILSFASKDLQPILDITQKTLKGSNYEVLVNSLWAEITEEISKKCRAIFAPGQMTVFHKNYTATISFISSFEGLCQSRRSMVYLRHHPTYIDFMKKWQLPVYFQLKLREIVVRVEDVLNDNTQSMNKGEDTRLEGTRVIMSAIQECWSDQVYLYGLSHRFWKLTLQLIKRYTLWVTDILQTANSNVKAMLYNDVQYVIKSMQTDTRKLILLKLPINVQEQPLIKESLQEALDQLKLVLKK